MVSGAASPQEVERSWRTPSRAWYSVIVLSLVSMMSNIDRGIVNLLVGPMKRDLHLTDSEISLLIGATFSIAYVFLSFPLSRLADTRSRKVILTTGLTLWSFATMLCGLAQALWQLFAARALVGAAESVKGPCSMSMIADLVPHEKLPRAFAIFQLGITGGMAGALVVGGLLLTLFSGLPPLYLPGGIVVHDWHLVLLATGFPGLLLAAVMAMTVREPARRDRTDHDGVPLREVARFLGKHWQFYLPLFAGIAIASIESYGLQAWRPAFFDRSYGWRPERIGPLLGGAILVATPLGLYLGTLVAEYLTRRRPQDALVLSCLIAYGLAMPLFAIMPLMPDPWAALALAFFGFTAWSMSAPGQNAAIQIVTPNAMRGQVSALYLFSISVVGGGFGPTAIALITDHVFRDEAMLRYAMATFSLIVGPLVLLSIASAVRPYRAAYRQMQGSPRPWPDTIDNPTSQRRVACSG
ncbi:MFS transporter [Bradyrhizobium sp. NP1]|uniref:MFS transporter n=1 Tax=Bradyrhizobium sp. NP1 TaxID=3049772 RepID=UPI0025A59890|nr:MFS transporter [Bradyrhizobium sp. NP1]WJR81993.1 MFS transporter [Bradyrhizobium sp. NP1]